MFQVFNLFIVYKYNVQSVSLYCKITKTGVTSERVYFVISWQYYPTYILYEFVLFYSFDSLQIIRSVLFSFCYSVVSVEGDGYGCAT